jgi:hypothetical protein
MPGERALMYNGNAGNKEIFKQLKLTKYF